MATKVGNIPCRRVFNSIVEGFPIFIIADGLGIPEKTVLRIKAAFIAAARDEALKINPNICPNTKFLVDNCISPKLVISLLENDRWSKHLVHLGREKASDEEVFAIAVDGKYDAIFTRDLKQSKKEDVLLVAENLTSIAVANAVHVVMYEKLGKQGLVNRFNFPVIVGFERSNINEDQVGLMYQDHKDKIDLAIKYKISPYIVVSKHGVKIGPSFNDIYKDFFDPKVGDWQTRVDAWTDLWVKRIRQENPHRAYNELDILALIARTRQKAQQCLEFKRV